jgi:predicted transcriptional regulator
MAESPHPDRIPITVEVSPAQKQKIEQLAERKGLSPEAVVRAAIDHELESTASNGEEAEEATRSESLLDATRDLAGSVQGPDAPRDLSSNPKHMNGYGQ